MAAFGVEIVILELIKTLFLSLLKLEMDEC